MVNFFSTSAYILIPFFHDFSWFKLLPLYEMFVITPPLKLQGIKTWNCYQNQVQFEDCLVYHIKRFWCSLLAVIASKSCIDFEKNLSNFFYYSWLRLWITWDEIVYLCRSKGHKGQTYPEPATNKIAFPRTRKMWAIQEHWPPQIKIISQ